MDSKTQYGLSTPDGFKIPFLLHFSTTTNKCCPIESPQSILWGRFRVKHFNFFDSLVQDSFLETLNEEILGIRRLLQLYQRYMLKVFSTHANGIFQRPHGFFFRLRITGAKRNCLESDYLFVSIQIFRQDDLFLFKIWIWPNLEIFFTEVSTQLLI